jgi:hypothetical protein
VAVQLDAGGHPSNDVSSVRLYSRPAGSNASWYLVATDTGAPWSINWATSPWVTDGVYELKAEAYRGSTLVATKIVRVNVRNADTGKPAVAITSPAAGAVVQGNVTIGASASDASGIARVELYSDSGQYLLATRTTAPWSMSWATDPWVKNGYQTLVARAYDNAGNMSQASVTVTVDNPGNGITLNNGLDSDTIGLQTSGSALWYGDDLYHYVGGDSARSGQIGHGQTSTLEFTASGLKTLRFVWRTSSELNRDYLELWIDGVKKNSISGNTAWAAQSWWLPSGTHSVKLVYRKDGGGSAGNDAGWVDWLRLE